MPERPTPDLDDVRAAMREHDERMAVERSAAHGDEPEPEPEGREEEPGER